jgi:hypothetical protein
MLHNNLPLSVGGFDAPKDVGGFNTKHPSRLPLLFFSVYTIVIPFRLIPLLPAAAAQSGVP